MTKIKKIIIEGSNKNVTIRSCGKWWADVSFRDLRDQKKPGVSMKIKIEEFDFAKAARQIDLEINGQTCTSLRDRLSGVEAIETLLVLMAN